MSTQKQVYFLSEADVEDHVKSHPELQWVVYQGIIYDVKDYLAANQHPGGTDVISKYFGQSIDDPFAEQGHSKTAKNLFKELPKKGLVKGAPNYASDSDTQGSEKGEEGAPTVAGLYGYELKGKWAPDYSKGVLWQLWILNPSHADYMKFIEEPKILVNPPRNVILFDTAFLERVTRAEWWHVPVFWSFFIVGYLVKSPLDPLWTAISWVIGFLSWSFAEYALHRFLFHGEQFWVTDHRPVKLFHFIIHGFHHAFP